MPLERGFKTLKGENFGFPQPSGAYALKASHEKDVLPDWHVEVRVGSNFFSFFANNVSGEWPGNPAKGKQSVRKKALTRTDCDILAALQVNAYDNDESIGKKVHRSRSVVLRRRTELEGEGVIRGYRADIDPKKVGLGTTVYTLVSLKQHGGGLVKEFGETVQAMPNVIEWTRISGSWDFMLKFAVKNTAHHDALLYRILDMANVSRVRGMHVHGIPQSKPIPLDGGELVPEDD